MIIIVTSRQSVFDLALQHCGTLEAAYTIAQDNGISLTDDLYIGQSLTIPDPIDLTMTTHYSVNHLCPATAITNEEINHELGSGEGIEFWAIEFDFVVS